MVALEATEWDLMTYMSYFWLPLSWRRRREKEEQVVSLKKVHDCSAQHYIYFPHVLTLKIEHSTMKEVYTVDIRMAI